MAGPLPSYSIRDLSRLTGLTSERIRAWERRYGLLRPRRQPSGYRVYGPDDLSLLLAVKRLVEAGNGIGTVAALSREELLAADRPPGKPQGDDPLTAGLVAALRAVGRGDMRAFSAALADASASTDAEGFYERFARPLLTEVGDLWALDRLPIWLEHYVTRLVRQRLETLWAAGENVDGPVALLFCPEGELHEIPLVGAATRLRALGYRPVILGANLPVEQALLAARHHGAALVALSVTHLATPAAARALAGSLAKLGGGVGVVAGGRAATRYRKEFEAFGIPVAGLEELASVVPPAETRPGRRPERRARKAAAQ